MNQKLLKQWEGWRRPAEGIDLAYRARLFNVAYLASEGLRKTRWWQWRKRRDFLTIIHMIRKDLTYPTPKEGEASKEIESND